ncbi:MAG TPA: Gfo/Idh/MocA family oxidoreductase [Candidatus Handelsmanbacteria bacterium]|nr:Gfo/Idh/MocA family oxidoreductase [Candidatus Handelsmanbacteria bacterium]|tara:strand:- start:416 stop:1366 length:951 start_codon:yes stop_codon:yes gene_type:complete
MKALRVAIAGAGGIGRHHAKWHAQGGSEVVAILGSQADRIPTTSRQLQELFGFHGRGYTDFDDLLARERPDVIDICTPNEAHFDLARQALDAGCHVLCEKPLVWASTSTTALEQARSLVDQAEALGLHLGMCSQYATSLAQYRRLCPLIDPTTSSSFAVEMETLSRGQPRDAAAIWVDMGPHPLSLILAAWPTASLLPNSLRVAFEGRTAMAWFTIDAEGHHCRCHVTVRDRDEGPLVRRFSFDDHAVDLSGRADDEGVYRSVMTQDGVEDLGDDLMRLLIEQFARAVCGDDSEPIVPPRVAMRNLGLQATILAVA